MEKTKCSYCQSMEELLRDFRYKDESYMTANILTNSSNGPIIYIEHMRKEKYGESGCNAWFKINYCPFCGRPLGEVK